jgi:hypothetical protein
VAEPTLNGFSGLLTIPTADTVDNGDFNIGLNSGELEDWDAFSYYGNVGVDEDMEIGVLMFRNDDERTAALNPAVRRQTRFAEDETFLSLKRTFDDDDDGPTFSAGVFDVTDEVETTVYMVGTWAQGRSVGEVDGKNVQFLNFHAGFAAGMFEDFFAGVDLRFGTDMTVMGEWIEDDVNVGVRLSPADNFNVDAGLLDVDDLAVNVSYSSAL